MLAPLFAAGRWPRTLSLLLAVGTVAYALVHPAGLGSNGSTLDRLFGALMAIGAVGASLDALHWQSERPHIRFMTDRRFTWPAMLAGAAWGLIST